MHRIDLEIYFKRIGHTGSTDPTLETLRALHLAHVTTFPFENLAAWTGRPVSLDLARIEEKLIRAGRGGYCFETNSLFAAVLRQLGYSITPLIARVRWMRPPDATPPRTHMLLRVMIADRPWTADVGFGSIGQTVPLALDTDDVQETQHESRRYRFHEGTITQQAQLEPDRWEDIYTFDLTEAVALDYEVANGFTSTHPESLFRKTLLVTAVREDHRLTLAFGEFTRRYLNGRVEIRVVADDRDLRNILVNEFHLPANDPAVREATLAGPAPLR